MGSEPPVARGLRPFALPHPKRLSTSPDSPAGLAHNTLRPGSLPLRRPWPIGVGRSPIHEGVGVSFGALALSDALIHPSAWKKNSRKFAVANGSSTYRQAPDYGLCYPLFVVKTLRLGTIRCTVVYQGVATRNSATTREMLAQQGSQ